MARPRLTEIQAIDPAYEPVVSRITPSRLWRAVHRVLRESPLCSIATVTPVGRPHVNTAYFAFSEEMVLYFLSHPSSLHCRNLSRNASSAVTVFASHQGWATPGRGLQLFGRCARAMGRHARDGRLAYGKRFRAYERWRANLRPDSPGRDYCFYRFVVSTLKILDERQFGGGVFIEARVGRGNRRGTRARRFENRKRRAR